MTIKYEYKCIKCSHKYIEQRLKNQPQMFTTCNSCGKGDYLEVSALSGFAVLDGKNQVIETVFANTQNEAEDISGKDCVRIPENNFITAFCTYDKTWNVFVPEGLVYEPISKKFMTQEEKDNL